MKGQSSRGSIIILLSYLPVLLRLAYDYDAWYIYALKMLVDTSYISFAWLIISGFRQGIVRRLLDQSLHGKFHNYLGYSAVIGVLIHPLAYIFLWDDWRIVFPFLHPYGILISLGGVAVTLAIVTGLTSYFIRKRYYDIWNVLHYLNYIFFIVIFIHVWQSLPLSSPTAVYYIVIFAVTVMSMIYKFMFDLQLLSFRTTVQSITPVAKDTYNVRFAVPPDQITTWEAGEYVMVTIDRTDDHHPFSVCRINADNTAEITFKVFGNFTRKFSRVKAGQSLYLAGPYGSANKMVEYRKEDLVLLAGGIGITPFRCIIYRLLERKDPRTIYLLYCVSDQDYFAFDDEFTALAKQYSNFKYLKMCARPCTDTAVVQGYISDTVIERVVGDMTKCSYVICGPDAMLAAATVLLRGRRVPRYQIHKEEFSY